MAGVYIHIPFCKSRCIYCGFFSTTAHHLRQRYVDAVCREATMRRHYLNEPVRTVYIGGGTPSQLTIAQLRQLLDAVSTGDVVETTIECNPDDVTPDFAAGLSTLPVNRVSMGAQTFDDRRLQFLRRRHTAAQVPEAVRRLRSVGIGNISIDLMYGFPGETLQQWQYDISTALTLGVEHLSAYSLMYEEGTTLYERMSAEQAQGGTGRYQPVSDELSLQMYQQLLDQLSDAGYEHYEISNFARPGYRSRHNGSYWQRVPYLGLGAAAHSYDLKSRQWNPSDLLRYIKGIENGSPEAEREELDTDTRYNDLVMLSLRTCEGLDLSLLSPVQRDYCLQAAQKYIRQGLLALNGQHRLVLTRDGLFVSDLVMSDLMMV